MRRRSRPARSSTCPMAQARPRIARWPHRFGSGATATRTKRVRAVVCPRSASTPTRCCASSASVTDTSMRASDAKQAAARIGARVAPRSAEIEQHRTLPRDIVDDIVDAGLFKLYVPRLYGGAEVTAADGIAVMEEVAYHDGSTGWCVMIAMTTGLLGGFL